MAEHRDTACHRVGLQWTELIREGCFVEQDFDFAEVVWPLFVDCDQMDAPFLRRIVSGGGGLSAGSSG